MPSFVIVFNDGGSKMSVSVDGETLKIRRPSKGMTKRLEEVAKAFCEDPAAQEFVDQTSEMKIIIGEERCG